MAVAEFAQGVNSSNYWAAHLNSLKPQTNSAATASTDTPAKSSADKPLITTGADGKSFFENVLDIVNPLEHLPVVSTIYHALTGNKSGDLEKMAGDALYGGVIGLASSVANIAFEKITGKDFGDTMLSMVGLGGDDDSKSGKNTALAANTAKTPDTENAVTMALNKTSLAPATIIAQSVTATPIVSSAIAPIATKAPVQLATPVSATPATQPAPTVSTQAKIATAPSTQTVIDISPQTDALLASLEKNGVTGAMQAQALDAYRRTMTMNTQQSATVH